VNLFSKCRSARRALPAATLLVLTIIACAQEGPTDDEIESLVTRRLTAANDIWDVQGLHKFRGRRRDDGTYVADVAYEMVFRENYMDSFNRIQKTKGSPAALQIMQPLVQKYGWWQRGRIVHEEERFHLIKSGKGWAIPND
jgi:hypothetical protein